MQIKGCPAYRDYDVFGLPNEGCCYCYMTYCKDVENCSIKEVIKKCKSAGEHSLAEDILNILHSKNH